MPAAATSPLLRRIDRIDWQAASASLDARGHAVVGPLLSARECATIARHFDEDARFRSTIEMGPKRYGEGRYRYYAYPLPEPIAALRGALYPPLAAIANDWRARLGDDERFPPELPAFLARCQAAGQERPTPLVLRYETGGYNCLHQDRYGDVAFPLQVAILLDRPEADFEGGEFLLVEQRPRMQSRGHAIRLERGEAIIFPNAERPAEGTRGPYRMQVRHGVAELRSGRRRTLGLIFHDAE